MSLWKSGDRVQSPPLTGTLALGDILPSDTHTSRLCSLVDIVYRYHDNTEESNKDRHTPAKVHRWSRMLSSETHHH